jgi:NIPSNAP
MVITELRRYRIAPGRMESWLEFFAGAIEEHVRRGMRVEYAGVDRETSTFVWLRSFEDEADRVDSKAGFYGSDWWTEREAFAMDHVLEYDVTFLAATSIRDGGAIVGLAVDEDGEPEGSRADAPPAGWQPSTRRTFAPAPAIDGRSSS